MRCMLFLVILLATIASTAYGDACGTAVGTVVSDIKPMVADFKAATAQCHSGQGWEPCAKSITTAFIQATQAAQDAAQALVACGDKGPKMPCIESVISVGQALAQKSSDVYAALSACKPKTGEADINIPSPQCLDALATLLQDAATIETDVDNAYSTCTAPPPAPPSEELKETVAVKGIPTSGSYCGSYAGLVKGKLTLLSATKVDVDMTILGGTTKCNNEAYTITDKSACSGTAGCPISVPDATKSGGCIDELLAKYGLSLKVTYFETSNMIELVTSLATVKLTKC